MPYVALRVALGAFALAGLVALAMQRAPPAPPGAQLAHRRAAWTPRPPSTAPPRCGAQDVQDAYMVGGRPDECVQVCLPQTYLRVASARGVRLGSTCAAFGCTEHVSTENRHNVQLHTFRCAVPLPAASPSPPPPTSSPPPPAQPRECRDAVTGDVALSAYPAGYVLTFREGGRDGEWGSQCGMHFDEPGAPHATIVCRSLGYAYANASATAVVHAAPELAQLRVLGGEATCPPDARSTARPLASLAGCEWHDDNKRECEAHRHDVRVHCVGSLSATRAPPYTFCAEPVLPPPLGADEGGRRVRERRVRAPKAPPVPKPDHFDEDDPATAGVDQCAALPEAAALERPSWCAPHGSCARRRARRAPHPRGAPPAAPPARRACGVQDI